MPPSDPHELRLKEITVPKLFRRTIHRDTNSGLQGLGSDDQFPHTKEWNKDVADCTSTLSSGQLARVYGFTDLDGSRPDAWRYMVEVQDAGKPADATGYR